MSDLKNQFVKEDVTVAQKAGSILVNFFCLKPVG